jgi:hypothetical protein
MRLLLGRPGAHTGRQLEIQTAPAVHLPTLSVSQTDHWTETTCVCLGLRLAPLASIGESVSCD